jgi:uncharacterized protein
MFLKQSQYVSRFPIFMNNQRKYRMNRVMVGSLISGGYRSNIQVDLFQSTEEIQIGSFVVIEGQKADYYGIVTDLHHGVDDIRFARHPARDRLPYPLSTFIENETLFSTAEVAISLIKPRIGGQVSSPVPSRSLPVALSPVYLTDQTDIENIIGPEDQQHFVIGYTREQSLSVPLDLALLVQRNCGVFGATGTGKSFLVRLLMAGLIQRDLASALIFDLHNEYGQDDIASDARLRVPGLKRLFPDQVRVFSLGKGATVRGNAPDGTLEIRLNDIHTDDLTLLSEELSLTVNAPLVLDQLSKQFGQENWLKSFRDLRYGAVDHDNKGITNRRMTVAEWAKEVGVHPRSAESLYSKLARVVNRPYVVNDCTRDPIGDVITLLKQGKTVVLSFGRFNQELDFTLVSNILMRRVSQAWEQSASAYRSTLSKEPRPLLVVLEEAHRFLNRGTANQTAFGQIARELRKSYLTLLIVDQRPSGIYDEVMSQLGTRICGWLGDDDDIKAVLAGLAGRDNLRALLSNLRPTQEALIMGWGVPLPLPIRVRRYDDTIIEQLKLGKTK